MNVRKLFGINGPVRELTLREKITKRVWIQCFVIGLIGGPIVAALGGGGGSYLWCCTALFLAPLVVEALRPTYVVEQ